MPPTIDQVNNELKQWVGWSEGWSDYIPFQESWGYPAGMVVEWCGGLICECVRRAGGEVSTSAQACIPNTWYTPNGVAGFQAWGRWHTTPQRGDLVYFDWGGAGLGAEGWRVDHVGWVEDASDWDGGGSIVTIEGNVSEACGRYRRWKGANYIVGFGRPRYADTPEIVVPNPPPVVVPPVPGEPDEGVDDMALVVEVLDPGGGASSFAGILGGRVFNAPDGSLVEANGWKRVKMSRNAWIAFMQAHNRATRLTPKIGSTEVYDEILKKKV